MNMYYCDGDFAFFILCLNACTALLAAIIIAFTRHGTPEPNPVVTNIFDIPIMRRVKFDMNYQTSVYLDDAVSDHDGAIIKAMILAGESITFRSAQARGLTRADWNKTRDNLVDMKLAERVEGNRLVLTAQAYRYFQIDVTKKEASE